MLQTTLQNTLVISDLPGPTGGIMLKSTTGATIIVNDTGIYIQNGKGASIVMAGPTVTINNGALVVDLSGEEQAQCPDFCCMSARRCCARTAGRRSRPCPIRA